MGLWDDLAAARNAVEADKAKLAADQALLDNLVASAVVGGPDVSSNQGDVDWTKVKGAGYDIVFPKVSDGDVIDTTFSPGRIASIKSAGLSYAPYYFARVAAPGNSERPPRAECAMAVYFAMKQGWGLAGDLPLVYDFEDLNGQTAAKAAAHLMGFVSAYKGLMGHNPIIYTAPGWFAQVYNALTTIQRTILAACPLWVAHWNVTAPTVPAPWSDWTFWQFTDKASVPGVTVAADNNRANITKTALDGLRIR
jgi:GH25 family lysozyme M1 (1,4-beta-N-acetylmuramidase)